MASIEDDGLAETESAAPRAFPEHSAIISPNVNQATQTFPSRRPDKRPDFSVAIRVIYSRSKALFQYKSVNQRNASVAAESHVTPGFSQVKLRRRTCETVSTVSIPPPSANEPSPTLWSFANTLGPSAANAAVQMAGPPRFSTERTAGSESVAEPGQSGPGAATRERFLEGEGGKAYCSAGKVTRQKWGKKPLGAVTVLS